MWSTPFLRVDEDRLDDNIHRAAQQAAANGYTLRPHAKTHKCVEIARKQLDAGAAGLSVATVGEAEVFAQAGFDDLFIAYPIWVDRTKAARLRRLIDAGVRIRVGVDSADAALALATRGLRLDVAVEIDSGHHRSGVTPVDAGAVATAAADCGHTVQGVFTFPGHSYSPGKTDAAAREESVALAEARDSLHGCGFEVLLVSGGSTPSFAAADGSVLTEARPGVYVFGDAQQWELGTIASDQIALTCESTVVSRSGGQIIVDAGSKALGADRAPWATGYGRVLDQPDARIIALSEHHATIQWPGTLPAVGSRLLVVPNHACNAVNLADEMCIIDSYGRAHKWAVAARGRNA